MLHSRILLPVWPGPMTFSKINLNACPQFLVVPHRCCTNVFSHHSWVEVQPARTKFREAYCLVQSTINRSAINRRIVEYHSVSKYSQHWSSCWAQCVFLVKLTCQLYLQVNYCLVWSAINRSAINRRIVEFHSVSKYELLSAMCFPGQANLSTVFAGALLSCLIRHQSIRHQSTNCWISQCE